MCGVIIKTHSTKLLFLTNLPFSSSIMYYRKQEVTLKRISQVKEKYLLQKKKLPTMTRIIFCIILIVSKII